jgi:serine/threonine protein kinase/tetratricopeptide (TPR) repeat protein
MLSKPQDDDLVINLVELALRCPSTERTDYIQRACACDPELLTQVKHYIEWEDRMNGFLLEPLIPRPVFEHPFEPGDLLQDRFRITREVAQGGMGIVYEAQDEKVQRRVALKCGKAGFRKRLSPEVRHASEISHPNVCKIFDIHTAVGRQGEIDFFTMEFLDGETLADRLQRGPLPEPEACTIATQICAGLAEAHRNRVIHGDLKTNNIFLTTAPDGTVRAVITDFGLAQGRDPSIRTGSFSAAGTPAYMAPELWTGNKPSIASDVYALGVCLYEMLAGQRPPQAEPFRVTRPLPPVHPKWDPILSRCMDAGPARRFQDAGQVAQALAPRSRRWLLAATATVLIAVLTGVVTFERATAPNETVRLAMLPFETGSSVGIPPDLLNKATDTLTRIGSSRATRFVVIPADSVVRNHVDQPDKASSVLAATHVLHGTLAAENGKLVLHAYLTDTRSHVNTGELTAEYKRGQERYLPIALAGMVTSSLRLPPVYGKAVVNGAALKDYLAGLNYLRRNSGTDNALAALERAVAADSDSPLTYAALAEAEWFKYFLTGDSFWLERTKDSIGQAQARNPDLPQVHRVTGLIKADAGLYEAAEAEYLRAIELAPNNGDAWRRLGQTYVVDNKLEQALGAYRRAVEVDPGMYRNFQALGALYHTLTRFREAVVYLGRAVQLEPDEPAPHYALGVAQVDSGQFVEGEKQLRAALALHETPEALNWLGLALMYQSRESEAVPYFWRALQLNPDRYLSWMDVGICFRRMNRRTEADQANRKGLQEAEEALSKNARNGYVRSFLAYLSASLGDVHRAESEIAQALQLSPTDNDVRWMAVLTYELLARRDDALAQLDTFSAESLADVSRWPDLAELHRDSRFIQLLASRPVK